MAEHHGPSLNTYIAIFTTLLALTGLTVAVAYMDLGPLAAPVAVGIAGVKATLVVLYFMHVKYESRLIGLYAASGFVFLTILIGITMGEFAGRSNQRVDRDDVLGPPVTATALPSAQAAPGKPQLH